VINLQTAAVSSLAFYGNSQGTYRRGRPQRRLQHRRLQILSRTKGSVINRGPLPLRLQVVAHHRLVPTLPRHSVSARGRFFPSTTKHVLQPSAWTGGVDGKERPVFCFAGEAMPLDMGEARVGDRSAGRRRGRDGGGRWVCATWMEGLGRDAGGVTWVPGRVTGERGETRRLRPTLLGYRWVG
jgi:hypothetical protein